MKWSRWRWMSGLALVGLSVGLYTIHYFIFGDAQHIPLWGFTSLSFLPISVLFVSRIIEQLLSHRD